jgi:glycosyltransferase involved in cell wall biosynthesis
MSSAAKHSQHSSSARSSSADGFASSESAPTTSSDTWEAMTRTELLSSIARLTTLNRRLEGENKHYKSVVDSVLGSLSWRITKPVRSVAALARGVHRTFFPLRNSETVELKPSPDRDTHQEGARFSIEGLNPVLQLSGIEPLLPSLKRGCLLKIGIQCTTASSHQVFFLHPLSGPTVLEHLRTTISAESGKITTALARVPAGTTRLLLEPFGMKGEFAIHSVSVYALGAPAALVELLRQRCGGQISLRMILLKASAAAKVFRAGGLSAVRAKLAPRDFSANYADWVNRYDTFDPTSASTISKFISHLGILPKISIVMPVFNVEERWLRAAIDSVRSQVYENWELCVADDCSTAPHIKPILEEYAKLDARIKITFRPENGHIVKATNSALELATGPYVAFLDNDDELTPDALAAVICAINEHPEGELFYSDEDKKTETGERFNPYFKSDWNPELILSQNYVCHFTVMRTATVKRLSGLRTGFEGAQDWDLVLRTADLVGADKIHHIPHVLYHWRVIAGSTAQSTSAKPYVLAAQQRAVTEHLERRGIAGGRVTIDEAISQLKVTLPVPVPHPLVSLVIPTKDRVDLLKQFLDSVLKLSSYSNFEFVIIDNGSTETETFTYFEELKSRWERTVVIRDEGPFNYARLNNRAVSAASGEYILLCNNDLEVLSSDWIEQLIGFAALPGVGAVGARLIYPNETIQHAGVVTGINGVAGHAFKGYPRHDVGYFNGAILPRTVSGCTAACLMLRKASFEGIGGFDEQNLAVAFNDVDLCLKLGAAGMRVVYCPYAELYHYESASRGLETTPEKFLRFEGEVATMKRRWGERLANDPYYSPNLTILTEDYRFAFPPRRAKPWVAV